MWIQINITYCSVVAFGIGIIHLYTYTVQVELPAPGWEHPGDLEVDPEVSGAGKGESFQQGIMP